MRYRIRFRRRAKEELSRAKQYSSQFSHDLDEWLSDIASSVENRSSTQSIDVVDILEKGINASGNPGPWTAAWAKWWQATPIDKVRAVIAFLKTKVLRGNCAQLRSGSLESSGPLIAKSMRISKSTMSMARSYSRSSQDCPARTTERAISICIATLRTAMSLPFDFSNGRRKAETPKCNRLSCQISPRCGDR